MNRGLPYVRISTGRERDRGFLMFICLSKVGDSEMRVLLLVRGVLAS